MLSVGVVGVADVSIDVVFVVGEIKTVVIVADDVCVMLLSATLCDVHVITDNSIGIRTHAF